MARTCFVTATDTGVGKTIVAATIVAGLTADGVTVHVRKPVLTGAGEVEEAARPAATTDLGALNDDELLAAVSGERPADVAPTRYAPAVSPHFAAELAGSPLAIEPIIGALRAAAGQAEALIVEGIGGLLVPLAPAWDVRRLAAELGWPVVIVARCGLGTINHTLLTLEAAHSSRLDVRAVVLTAWPATPGQIEQSNRETIERLGGVEVATLADLGTITRATLAQAATTLPYARWLAG